MPAPVSPPLVPKTMRAAVFDVMAPHGVRIAERPRPGRAVAKGCCGRGAVVCAVRACGVNPVDAKYVIGDKLPESWMAWAARRVRGAERGTRVRVAFRM